MADLSMQMDVKVSERQQASHPRWSVALNMRASAELLAVDNMNLTHCPHVRCFLWSWFEGGCGDPKFSGGLFAFSLAPGIWHDTCCYFDGR